ncbi:MAG: hypothetical protein IIA41_00320 [SAR324 cluster bacterium]|nr:hypothetical protein [SAR324 cluster bacterium]MCZ6748551.1 hypothetical protein [SAR324 cluster bacterium]
MSEPSFTGRPYLQILFECCQVYQRVYKDRSGRFYLGRCPTCLRQIRFRVAPHGSPARRFRVR